jgi:hypothetical protein
VNAPGPVMTLEMPIWALAPTAISEAWLSADVVPEVHDSGEAPSMEAELDWSNELGDA